MLAIDFDNLAPRSHNNPQSLLRSHPSSSTQETKKKSLDIFLSADHDAETLAELGVKFMTKVLSITSSQLFLTIGMAFFFVLIQKLVPLSQWLSDFKGGNEVNELYYWSILISFCLFSIHSLPNTCCVNLTLVGAFAAMTYLYLNEYPVNMAALICFSCPLQIFCLTLLVRMKEAKITVVDFLISSTVSTLINLTLVKFAMKKLGVFEFVSIIIICAWTQLWFLCNNRWIMTQEKVKFGFGEGVQALFSFIICIFGTSTLLLFTDSI